MCVCVVSVHVSLNGGQLKWMPSISWPEKKPMKLQCKTDHKSWYNLLTSFIHDDSPALFSIILYIYEARRRRRRIIMVFLFIISFECLHFTLQKRRNDWRWDIYWKLASFRVRAKGYFFCCCCCLPFQESRNSNISNIWATLSFDWRVKDGKQLTHLPTDYLQIYDCR